MNATLSSLKRSTHQAHLDAEAAVAFIRPGGTLDDYRHFLSRLLGFHAPIEDVFAGHAGLAAVGFDAAARRKRTLLEQDLRELGVDPDAAPRCRALPACADTAQALGVGYVIEGSTLGGAAVRSRMAHLDPAARAATTFLRGYRDQTGPRWRAFCALAHRELGAEADLTRAITAARATFAALSRWLRTPAGDL